MSIDLSSLVTETRNVASENIDELDTLSMLKVINQEDQKVALAIDAILPAVASAVDVIVEAFSRGGRLVYAGAGTSGRLGILDASECPPTFGVSPEQVIGLIAGGHPAILKAVENAEDNQRQGARDVESLQFSSRDVLVGIAASGRTPYVLGAMEYASSVGATVIAISCNPSSPISLAADIALEPVVGAEVVTGSSRMKAGTAQKLILNMLSTGAMIQSGKVYGNLMVDVEATNAKLVERQKKIVMEATECSLPEAVSALAESKGHCKTAIVMILTGQSAQQATDALTENNGFIRRAIS